MLPPPTQQPPKHDNVESPNVRRLRNLLREILRVTVNDGRIFLGTFAGTDQLLNILLINTEEYRIQGQNETISGRFVGQILIPWALVVKIESASIDTIDLYT
ncbi:hypothetical protein AMATHDRAFT_192638 [Amanita thiersii Skay4041]|uniref:Sm domain-containing protein n=1 Tax=Amanita thiersii Skay4041 TaxID=703135 RepID=A0A2A9NN03_9AGAR|nr:hypothetical protein AMATHDRAFT_192638 [Amanita thiersii Skay4041]